MNIRLSSRRVSALSWISTLSSFSRPGAIADFSHAYRLLQSLDFVHEIEQTSSLLFGESGAVEKGTR
jgi:hypothetical protein